MSVTVDTTRTALQHGELLMIPVVEVPADATLVGKRNAEVVAHSESGAHHVVEAPMEFSVYEGPNNEGVMATFLSIPAEGSLVHKKSGPDQHKTLPVAPGAYIINEKTEYDPFAEEIRRVRD